MPKYEYKVVPAPAKGKKAKGVRGTEARFAFALEDLMNHLGAEGWEYQRAETLPSEERHGLTSVTTTYRNMLVFRRALDTDPIAAPLPQLPAPDPELSKPASETDDNPANFFGGFADNGVEDANDLSSPAASLLMERAARLNAAVDADIIESEEEDNSNIA